MIVWTFLDPYARPVLSCIPNGRVNVPRMTYDRSTAFGRYLVKTCLSRMRWRQRIHMSKLELLNAIGASLNKAIGAMLCSDSCESDTLGWAP